MRRCSPSGPRALTLVQAVSGSALDELRRWLDAGGDVEQSIVEDARLRLHELASAVAARHAIDVVRPDHDGPFGRGDRARRRRARADLIVTGTLGAGLFRHHLIGSTAERVVKKIGTARADGQAVAFTSRIVACSSRSTSRRGARRRSTSR